MSASSRVDELLKRLRELAPEDDARAQSYIAALEQEFAKQQRTQDEQEQLIAQYTEAYEKLTQPANRIGVFLQMLEGDKALIVSGDAEMVTLVDPTLDRNCLTVGGRVILNEAYAIIGTLPEHAGGAFQKVAEIVDEARLRVGGEGPGQAGRILFRSANLGDAPIKKGDEVRVEPSGRFAVEHVAQPEVQDYFVEEVPATPWSAVGGQEEAIRLIRETIEHPMLYPELYEKFNKKPVKGILLYGPPGCGKTLIGKAIAYNLAKEYSERLGKEVREYFMHISGPKILNMWLGETERKVREIFEIARSKAKEGRLVVIFMDEAESILRTRSGGRWLNISNTVVPQFCAELDGLVSLENVVLILTSNRPDYIDPAILRPERIDRKVKIRRPTKDATRDILKIYLKESLPVDPELLEQNDGEPACAQKALMEATLAELWRENDSTQFLQVMHRNGNKETLHFHHLVSGALIKSIVDRAKDAAIRRAIEDPDQVHGLRIQDMIDAIQAEYRENEIFPKSDVMEDWLKLIDVEPESVASVKPVQSRPGDDFFRKTIV